MRLGFVSIGQKCVRRSRADLAAATALELLRADPMELLRRLPIIAVEDVHVTHHLPVAVWFMVAGSKGYRLCNAAVDWLLAYTHWAASCPHRECFPVNPQDEGGSFDLASIAKVGELRPMSCRRPSQGRGLTVPSVLCDRRPACLQWTLPSSMHCSFAVLLVAWAETCGMSGPANSLDAVWKRRMP
jgi:hypothetical protein